METIKKKFGVNGSIKKMEDIDPVNDVFQFTGDHGIKIKDVLIKDYSKKELNLPLNKEGFPNTIYSEPNFNCFETQL